jgi:hypothetical protein
MEKLTNEEWELLLTVFDSFVTGYPGKMATEAVNLLGRLHMLVKGD